jgi:hypothetical protein
VKKMKSKKSKETIEEGKAEDWDGIEMRLGLGLGYDKKSKREKLLDEEIRWISSKGLNEMRERRDAGDKDGDEGE